MKATFSSLLAFFAVLVVLIGAPGCQSYDQLISLDEKASASWADYEVQLQRRADLVPNLVSTVKAQAKYEEEALTAVTKARSEATSVKLSADDLTDPAKVAQFEKAQEGLKGSLSRLMVSNEKYPELQANQAFMGLQKELAGTENRIAKARGDYNDSVRLYNTELAKIKGQAINKITGKAFKPRVYFSASEGAKDAPKVQF
jgi:LemA protein